MIYGEGEYATAEESSAAVEGNFMTVVGAQGEARLKVLHRRKVRGYVAALIKVADPSKTAALSPLGIMQAANVTEEAASDIVKGQVAKDKVVIVSSQRSWEFHDGLGAAVTENDFVRRFREVIGSNELDVYESRKNKGGLITAGVLTAVTGGVLAWNLSQLPWLQPADGALCGQLACTLTFVSTPALAGSLALLSYQAFSSSKYDGDASEHHLTEIDARTLVNRYNRALVRKTIRSVQTQQREGRRRMDMQVGLGTLGIGGEF